MTQFRPLIGREPVLEMGQDPWGHLRLPERANFLIFSHRKLHRIRLNFGGQHLEPATEVKWLGLVLDDKLTFSKHLAEVKKTAEQTLVQ